MTVVNQRLRLAARLLPLGMLLGLASCTTINKLEGQAEEVRAIISPDEFKARAYRCAPRERALAEAHVDFGEYELGQGNFVRAKDHLRLAETNAKLADRLSDFPECRDKKVKIVMKATKKTNIVDAKPTPTDKDGDGILDKDDKCPDKPEDFDKFEDKDGCPDLDNDKDGIADLQDRCPDVAEDKDGFEDTDGCPELDNDGDGIIDVNEQAKCRDVAEDFDGYQDEDGCPEPDNDNDSIVDILDQCPNKPEDYDGDLDGDGCPEERKLVAIKDGKIQLRQKVFFRSGKATILSRSFSLLDEVSQILLDNQNIHIRVEGHTDDVGRDSKNKILSQRRANSVMDYLIRKGVGRERMTALGHGEDKPLCEGIEDLLKRRKRARRRSDRRAIKGEIDTCRSQNRRVEVHITKQ